MTITQAPPEKTAPAPISDPPTAVSGTPDAVSETPDPASQTPKRKTIKPGRDRLMTALSVAAAIGGTLVGVIGFAMSYSTLAKVALSWGFSESMAPWFPVGVDASIVAFLALDLYLIRKDTPWPLLRVAAHAMTAATVWFNASSQGEIQADPVQAASHGVMPVLFVIGVEAARKLFIKKAQLEAGTHTDRVPMHRWVLAPWSTARIYRRMRLWGITSYPEMVRREQDLRAYELWLKRKHGKLSQASEDELLPMTMAPYGYTVAEALAMPDEQDREAEARAEESERRRLAAETRRQQSQTHAEEERLRAAGRLEAVRAQVAGETEQARAAARTQKLAAEQAAAAEAEALETVGLREARARAAAAERTEAEEREAAAEVNRRAAETEKAAAETQRAAAEARARQAEEERLQEVMLADAARAKQAAAEAEQRAAEARLAAAETDRRAVEIEDEAKLTSRQRAVRRVARMALAAGLAPDGLAYDDVRYELCERISIADVQREVDVSSSDTASKYRQEAAVLLADGYRP